MLDIDVSKYDVKYFSNDDCDIEVYVPKEPDPEGLEKALQRMYEIEYKVACRRVAAERAKNETI